jgi:hypothetical protein
MKGNAIPEHPATLREVARAAGVSLAMERLADRLASDGNPTPRRVSACSRN